MYAPTDLFVQNDTARICMRRIDKKRIFFDVFFSMAIVRVFFFVHSLLAYFSNVIPLTARISEIRWRCSAYALIFLLDVLIPWVMDTYFMRMFFISFKNNILFINGHVTQACRLTPKIMSSPCLECSVFCEWIWNFWCNIRDNFHNRMKKKYSFPSGN